MFQAVFHPIIRSFSAVQRHWYSLYSSVTVCYQDPDPGSTRSPSCINCTSAVVWLTSSWWWAERLPETCRVIITNKIGTQCNCWYCLQGKYIPPYRFAWNFIVGTFIKVRWYLQILDKVQQKWDTLHEDSACMKISHHVCSLWWQQNVVCVRYKLRSWLVFILQAGCVMY
jgi:hypothetical protein